MKILVTGGAGFIGSAVCRLLVSELGETVLNLDKLTYAANLASLKPIENSPRYRGPTAPVMQDAAGGGNSRPPAAECPFRAGRVQAARHRRASLATSGAERGSQTGTDDLFFDRIAEPLHPAL